MARKPQVTLDDTLRENIIKLKGLGMIDKEISKMLGPSVPSINRLVRAYNVALKADPEEVREFTKSDKKGLFIQDNWTWACRVTGYKEPKPIDIPVPEYTKDEQDKLDEICMRLGELHRMLEKNLCAVNTALTTILDCWGVEKGDKNGD